MTDAEQDKLRRELPAIAAQLDEKLRTLVMLIDQRRSDLRLTQTVKDARAAIAEFDAWLRRGAGPEDLAKLEGSNAP